MIVRNEIHIIKESLDSVVQFIDYWVINDNGSTDGTQQFIHDYFQEKGIPGELITIEWINFGFNRTEVFKRAEGKSDYVFVLDADDVFILNSPLPQLKSDAYYISVGSGDFVWERLQLFKNNLDWKYVGILHEYPMSGIARNFSKLKNCAIECRTLGSRNSLNKEARDIEVLLQGIKEEPNNARYYFYLGQTYRDARIFDKAIENYQKCVSIGRWTEEIYYALYQIIECKLQIPSGEKTLQEIIDLALHAYDIYPYRSEALCSLVRYCRITERYRLGYIFGKMGLEIPFPENNSLPLNKKVYDHELFDETGICASWLNILSEAARLYKKALNGKLVSPEDRIRIKNNLLKLG